MMLIAIVNLWKAQDSFLIKIELKMILFFSFPFFLIWSVSHFKKFPTPLYPSFWTIACLVIVFVISVVFPVIKSFTFQKLQLIEKKNQPSRDSLNDIDEDDFLRLVLGHPVFLKSFEK